MLYVGIYLSI